MNATSTILPFLKQTIHIEKYDTENAKAIVVLVHGFGEHLGRYAANVIPMLTHAGCTVYGYDNFGHGKSSGKRGHCQSYESLLQLLNTIINLAKKDNPELPLFLYGHSMGGNLVLNYGLRYKEPLAGIIATSPYLKLAFHPPKWKLILGRALLKIAPSITLPTGMDTNLLSRNQDVIDAYNDDPLVHDRVSPMFSFPIMDAGEWAITHANQLTISTLLVHGSADKIIDVAGTKAFHDKAATTTTFYCDEGGYHELHWDANADAILAMIQNWLQQQL